MSWCPKHRWEFTNPEFTTCPSCGTPLVAERPPASEPEPPAEPDPPASDAADTLTATRLGMFDRLVAPALLDLLRDRGIKAFEAQSLADPVSRRWDSEHTDVWVETPRLDEAKAIATDELPGVLENASIPDEDASDSWGESDGESDDDIEWTPFGWLETHVALIFLEVCEEEAISARTEYPLDQPLPVWVTPGMRVQVHVGEFFVEEAEQLLERVEARLEERGLSWEDPLCDLSGP